MRRSKTSQTVWFSLALLIFAVAAPRGAEPEKDNKPTARMRLLVPAYFYPAGAGLKHWDNLIGAARQAPIVAIVNPASGPGKERDPQYVKVIDRASEASVVLIGYVSTRYAKRQLVEVKADVERWYQLYPKINGIFFDEQASAVEQIDYYAAAYQHVKKAQSKSLVVTNPGTVCAEEYVSRPAADVVCLVEANKEGDLTMPEWTARYKPDRFAALLYGVKKERQAELVRTMVQKRIGNAYFTHANLPNPWDRLPDGWEAEVAAVREANKDK